MDAWNTDAPNVGDLEDANWYELRVSGSQPERRAYHSSFINNDK